MGDPACWLHLLDEEGRLPDPVDQDDRDEDVDDPA
jgi:hypothetical protein